MCLHYKWQIEILSQKNKHLEALRDSGAQAGVRDFHLCSATAASKRHWKLAGENYFGHVSRDLTVVWSKLKCLCCCCWHILGGGEDAILAVPQLGEQKLLQHPFLLNWFWTEDLIDQLNSHCLCILFSKVCTWPYSTW